MALGIFVATKKVANYADKIAKMSRRVGISAQILQELKHAAELSGTSLNEMIVGMRRLSVCLQGPGAGRQEGK